MFEQVELFLDHANQSVSEGVKVRHDAEDVLKLLQDANMLGTNVVAEIYAFVRGLETGQGKLMFTNVIFSLSLLTEQEM